MYRQTIVLFIAAAAAAPQDNSVTYIKMLPQTEEVAAPSYRESRIENIPLTIGKLDTSEDSTPTTESIEDVREDSTLEDSAETTTTTEKYAPKTTPEVKKPKFYSKLSYFEKPSFNSGLTNFNSGLTNFNSRLTNLVERSGKRKFRSKCRCERISNCPKLQITVPRCPEEYFLCCF